MRTLGDHKVNPANDLIDITVLDPPDASGASHHYRLTIQGSPLTAVPPPAHVLTELNFQIGPIAEYGVNGITQEALIEVLIDRLRGFQTGPFACPANESALGYLQNARGVLLARTQERMERGVEGTHEV